MREMGFGVLKQRNSFVGLSLSLGGRTKSSVVNNVLRKGSSTCFVS